MSSVKGTITVREEQDGFTSEVLGILQSETFSVTPVQGERLTDKEATFVVYEREAGVNRQRFYFTMATDNIGPLVEREKTVTIRVPESYEPHPGDLVDLVTTEGHRFAVARVQEKEMMSVEDVADEDFDGHKNYRDVEKVMQAMEFYYPDNDFTVDTPIVVYHLTDFKVAGGRREVTDGARSL